MWKNLKNKSIYALAPMADITDSAFRQICKDYGADVVYSEMASVTALVYASQKTLEMLCFEEKERPYVVQLFGNNPDHFAQATRIITEKIKPDGIDINFGCPVKKIQKQGAGAVLMANKKLAKDVIKSTINNTDLPVSIKTRTKVGDVGVLEFLDYISDLDIKALMIHGRTLPQGFSGDIDMEVIKKARGYFGGIILANGGINNYQDAEKVLQETEADGLGIARGALGRPWIFEEIKKGTFIAKQPQEIFDIALRHSILMHKIKGDQGIIEMRKHLCWYVHGLHNASELRQKLTQVKTIEDIRGILR